MIPVPLRERLPRLPLMAVTLAVVLGLAPLPAVAESVTGDRGSDMAVDLIVVRPLGIVATAIGTVGFVLALPFSLPTGTAGDTAREWVADPFEYTFNRPLGEFHVCGADRHPCGH